MCGRQASSPHHQIVIWICSDGICQAQQKTNTETAMLKYAVSVSEGTDFVHFCRS